MVVEVGGLTGVVKMFRLFNSKTTIPPFPEGRSEKRSTGWRPALATGPHGGAGKHVTCTSYLQHYT